MLSATNWIDDPKKCFYKCGGKSGKCSYCNDNGVEGYCCRNDFEDNGDCPDQAMIVAPFKRHSCVHQSNSNSGKTANKKAFYASF